MAESVGVVFSQGGKVYSFDPNGLELRWDERVICQTARGLEHGRVVQASRPHDDVAGPPLRKVLRRATRARRRDAAPQPRGRARGHARLPRRAAARGRHGAAAGRRGRLRRQPRRALVPGRRPHRAQAPDRRPGARARPARRAAAGQPARGRARVRLGRAVRREEVLQPLPLARAADHAAHGQGPGPAHEPGPHHRACAAGCAAAWPSSTRSTARSATAPPPSGAPCRPPRARASCAPTRVLADALLVRLDGAEHDVEIKVDDAQELRAAG